MIGLVFNSDLCKADSEFWSKTSHGVGPTDPAWSLCQTTGDTSKPAKAGMGLGRKGPGIEWGSRRKSLGSHWRQRQRRAGCSYVLNEIIVGFHHDQNPVWISGKTFHYPCTNGWNIWFSKCRGNGYYGFLFILLQDVPFLEPSHSGEVLMCCGCWLKANSQAIHNIDAMESQHIPRYK